jgi:hypothetical protein
MRIWGVPVRCMCDKHLLGEHVEMHMFKAVIEAGKKVDGYIRDKLLDTDRVVERHAMLVSQMTVRGMRHQSPMNIVHYPEGFVHRTSVVQNESEMELARRCPDCRMRFESFYGPRRFVHIPQGGDAVVPFAGAYRVKYSGQEFPDLFTRRDRAVKFLEDHRRKMRNGS